jgi:ankyrin repeat protein
MYRPEGGFTALLFAAREGCIPCAKTLIDAGADVNMATPRSVTPLIEAIENFHFDFAKYLIGAGADINRWDWWGRTPLYSAVDLNTVPHGGRPDRPSTDKTTSLELIAMLLDGGANPNSQLKLRPPHRQVGSDRGCDLAIRMGSTPLMRAAKAFDADAIKLLLAHGALVNLPTAWGITPTMSAAGLGSKDCDTRGRYDGKDVQQRSIAALKLLIAAGGKINDVMGGDNRDVLDAGWRSRFEVPDEALQINIGQTPLHGAAFWGWNDVVTFLVEEGADLDAKDARGMTAVDAAMGRAGGNGRGTRIDVHEDTAKLLKDLMAKHTAAAEKTGAKVAGDAS